jgi:CRP/FNR family transcriptional regulator
MYTLHTCLIESPVFSKLSTTDHAELARLAVRKTYHKGQFICMQGDIWPHVLFLASGRLGWSMLSPEGKRQVVFRLNPCDVVWGHSLFDADPMPASLEVMEESEIYYWHGEKIIPIVSRHVEAVWDITRELIATMRQVREVVYGFAFHPVAGRLARLLLHHYHPVDGQPAPRDLTLDEMADSIGTTRELVSKTLHRFADEGMIEISRVQFVFTNRSELEQMAGHDE